MSSGYTKRPRASPRAACGPWQNRVSPPPASAAPSRSRKRVDACQPRLNEPSAGGGRPPCLLHRSRISRCSSVLAVREAAARSRVKTCRPGDPAGSQASRKCVQHTVGWPRAERGFITTASKQAVLRYGGASPRTAHDPLPTRPPNSGLRAARHECVPLPTPGRQGRPHRSLEPVHRVPRRRFQQGGWRP